jgi:hypothetical protein
MKGFAPAAPAPAPAAPVAPVAPAPTPVEAAVAVGAPDAAAVLPLTRCTVDPSATLHSTRLYSSLRILPRTRSITLSSGLTFKD